MFSLSSHEAYLRRPSRPVTSHGTAPCCDWVAFPFSTRAMQGTRSTDSGRVATRGRVYPLSIKNIVVGLPHPAVPGDCRTSDANRSYARSLKPTGGHARPTDRIPSDHEGAGTQEPAEPPEGHSGGAAQKAGRNPGQPSRRAGPTRVMPCGHRPPGPVEGPLPVSRDSDSACGAHNPEQLLTPVRSVRSCSANRRQDEASVPPELLPACPRSSSESAAPRHGPDHALDHEERDPKSKRMPTANVGPDARFATGLRRYPGQVSGQNALHSGVHK